MSSHDCCQTVKCGKETLDRFAVRRDQTDGVCHRKVFRVCRVIERRPSMTAQCGLLNWLSEQLCWMHSWC